jgi:hypothetical protein
VLTVAHDNRVKAGVFNHVSLRVSDVVWTGISCGHVRQMLEPNLTRDQLADAWAVISPASYLHRLARGGLQNLLIWARFDTTFLPEYSRAVVDRFRELKVPHRVVSLPCGHYTTGKPPFVWIDGLSMARFLRNVL